MTKVNFSDYMKELQEGADKINAEKSRKYDEAIANIGAEAREHREYMNDLASKSLNELEDNRVKQMNEEIEEAKIRVEKEIKAKYKEQFGDNWNDEARQDTVNTYGNLLRQFDKPSRG